MREFRVEELAQAAGIGVATVRFYQSRGLLPKPERRGRVGWYNEDHLERVQRIRALNQRGLTLEAVGRALASGRTLEEEESDVRESLLGALDEVEGGQTFTRAELAARAQVPEFLMTSFEAAGLLHPIPGEPARYTEADLRSMESGRRLMESGLPMDQLFALAREHSTYTENLAERAVEIFEGFARAQREDGDASAPDGVTETFRELLPAVTTLVAMHFQRTLIRHARERLAETGDMTGLAAALEATESARLKLTWT